MKPWDRKSWVISSQIKSEKVVQCPSQYYRTRLDDVAIVIYINPINLVIIKIKNNMLAKSLHAYNSAKLNRYNAFDKHIMLQSNASIGKS
jgi:hypothetical protein